MPPTLHPRNPYIAGKALGDERGFFGREDVFRLVENALSSPDQNALVLCGQRRIGKTSILLQLRRRLPSPPFRTIYFDLMDQARKPLSTVLYELAATVAAEVNLPSPVEADFARGDYFRENFLPSVYRSLGNDFRPVFLFDEFDVLDVAAEEQLPPTAAARAFFPYLRRLFEGEPLLAFVFVVGRKADDLSIDVKATFKAARYQRISMLDDESARGLIRLAEREGSLRFSVSAIDRLLGLTAHHPYFTQLMCQLLFDRAYAESPPDTPTIDRTDVEVVVPKALESGENIFEWIWDGLPPAERVIFSAIAGATNENAVISEDELTNILQGYGIRILIRELELAPKTLLEWEMLRRVNDGYGFFTELMRRWVAERKPLPKVKDELDRVNPIADQNYQLANTYYRLSNLKEAIAALQAALQVNPNHLKARLLLGETLCEQGALDEAVKQLEEAYRYDEDAARYPLIRVLLAQGDVIEQTGHEDDALNIYQRVLEISPREVVARERAAGILAIRRNRALEASAAEVEILLQDEEWDQAAEIYRRLLELDPEDKRWSEGLERAEKEQGIARRYTEGLGATQQSKWAEAQRAFADVVYVRPDYKEAAYHLATVTRNLKAQQSTRPPQAKSLPSELREHTVFVREHTALVRSVAFSPDGRLLASGGDDPTVRLWSVSDGSLLRMLEGNKGPIWSVTFSPDGSLLASGSADGTVCLWKTIDGSLQTLIRMELSRWAKAKEVWNVAFSPDGSLRASGSSGPTVRLWSVSASALIRELKGHKGQVWSVVFDRNGSLLASGGTDRTLRLWSVSDGKTLRFLEGHEGTVFSVAFSPDGSSLASGGDDATARLWKTSGDGNLVRTLEGHRGAVFSVAFSPDGSLLASGGDDAIVRLWQVNDGSLVRALEGHEGTVFSVAFSPDGSLLASGGDDKTVRLLTFK